MKKLKLSPLSKPSFGQFLFAFLTLVLRFELLPPNVSGVGAVGFTSPSIWLLIMTTFGFDLVKGGFYSGFWWTYVGFLGYWLLGWLAGKSITKKLAFLPLASLLFFLVSNFGVWLSWYPQNWQGFLTCYTLALPFYRNTLVGDLVFGWGWMAANTFISVASKQFKFWSTKARNCLNQ